MKASLDWMKDYVAVEGDVEALAEHLTRSGIPVEEVQHMDKGIKKVFTGKITEITPHPDADKLVVCQLECLTPEGEEVTKQIVTGATNVRVGQIVPVAYHKSKLPDKSISKGKLRGVMSEGMLCSIGELGLPKDVFTPEEGEGIYILPETTKIGEDIKDTLCLNDTVYLFELTPNRADCFSMIGLSREIAVLTDAEAKMPEVSVKETGEDISKDMSIAVADADLCPRFMTRVIKNVKVGPSPLWMQNRLRNAGIRPINNIVDVTNYVMVEFGQPMHAYDYAKVASHHIDVRLARPDETVVTLDGEERKLQDSMLVIADTEKVLGVAGIMGGELSEVTNETTDIILEAAAFYGKSVRRTSKALGLRSEASGRFERGVDTSMIPMALDRAAQLISQMLPEAVVEKGVLDVYAKEKEIREVSFSVDEINAYLGTSIAEEEMVSILEKLQFALRKEGANYVATIPSWRDDVAFMCDIAEEVARIFGYDNIQVTTPVANLQGGVMTSMQELTMMANDYLVESGMNECITFSFMHKDSLKKLLLPEGDRRYMAVPIMNPISEEFPYMRTTLVPSILETAGRNMAKKNHDLWLFEIGAVYEPEALPIENFVPHRQMVTGLMVGNKNTVQWPQQKEITDFFDVKGIVEGLLQKIGVENLTIERAAVSYLHPGVSATYRVGDVVVATFGELHPEVAKNYDLPENTFIFEIDLQAMDGLAKSGIQYKGISKFPAVTRDLAIVGPKTVSDETIMAHLRAHGGEFLTEVHLFDIYEGEHIAEGYRSMAYALTFQAMDKTLEDKDVDTPIEEIVSTLGDIHCQLR